MKKGIFASAAGLAVLGFSLACGGAGGNAGNVTSCEAYVEHVNGLECVAIDLDKSLTCPPELAQSPCDMASYYDCMKTNSGCKDGYYDAAGTSNCQMDCF